jgi:hypothetical protein
MTRNTKTGVTRMTTGIVPMETQLVASLHWRSVVKGILETTTTCTMSSMAEMHMAGLKTGAKIGSVWSRSSVGRGTRTIMAPTTTNLTASILQNGDMLQEVSRLITKT